LIFKCFDASTLQRFNASTLQRFNASTLQRFNASTLRRFDAVALSDAENLSWQSFLDAQRGYRGAALIRVL
jgi:hypothetical protein